ncbi:hypothetical protein LMG29542_01898 [Paraburkholderia humisilvae]|uniref:Uncharacterized protein n=1 Tax=Paraburkholderia humisilvae TaxID=627669 RepID=A0A6J5DF04_9BURK|nr:hypothetical protein LMG29542_01898 [Paraburkholderia humisilvae]
MEVARKEAVSRMANVEGKNNRTRNRRYPAAAWRAAGLNCALRVALAKFGRQAANGSAVCRDFARGLCTFDLQQRGQ